MQLQKPYDAYTGPVGKSNTFGSSCCVSLPVALLKNPVLGDAGGSTVVAVLRSFYEDHIIGLLLGWRPAQREPRM